MSEVTTIDEMISCLERLKTRLGGDCRVLASQYGELTIANVSIAHTGKANKWKTVSRGGDPCVIIFG